jgi:hypothetical protein
LPEFSGAWRGTGPEPLPSGDSFATNPGCFGRRLTPEFYNQLIIYNNLFVGAVIAICLERTGQDAPFNLISN